MVPIQTSAYMPEATTTMLGSSFAMLTEFLGQQLQIQPAEAGQPALALNRQLYLLLKKAMLDQVLRHGERLPSSRVMAASLHVARNTVMSALSQLEAEGFLETRQGSGTFVRFKRPAISSPSASSKLTGVPRGRVQQVSARGQRLLKQDTANELEVQPFTQGFPDFSPFPVGVWQKLLAKHWRLSYASMLDYNDTGGFKPLKRAIAQYLRLFRGMRLEEEQVLVTTGTQQSLGLCAILLADPGDTVWVEDPLYWGAAQMFRASGLRMHGIPTDAHGLNLALSDQAPAARMVYITPSHQYPTGGVLTPERRLDLLRRCRDMNAWALEDDYDSEFRFAGQQQPSLHALDLQDRVFYMRTFSKTLYPGIKMAYVVVPPDWVSAFKRTHYDLNRPGLLHQQVAMAEFIELGHFQSTIRQARATYAQRRQALLQALAPCLGLQAHISGTEQGLHLCLHLPHDLDDVALAQQAQDHGLTVRALSRYAIARNDLRGLVIGYGYAPLEAIQKDGPVLAQLVLRALRHRHA
jgi:GntR family transcriptional regulator/MocR family aminotransferase